MPPRASRSFATHALARVAAFALACSLAAPALALDPAGTWQKIGDPPNPPVFSNFAAAYDSTADRLLVYEIREGWEPLCAFLGVPVPEGKPFPRLNDAAEFRARIQRGARAMRAIGYSILGLAALILLVVAIRLGS